MEGLETELFLSLLSQVVHDFLSITMKILSNHNHSFSNFRGSLRPLGFVPEEQLDVELSLILLLETAFA